MVLPDLLFGLAVVVLPDLLFGLDVVVLPDLLFGLVVVGLPAALLPAWPVSAPDLPGMAATVVSTTACTIALRDQTALAALHSTRYIYIY